ncbi:MAG: PglZ domain-containing protein [Bacteroidetes bacterium]|nr:PglZ domain-containing protein [Bacteroidota bacterium]
MDAIKILWADDEIDLLKPQIFFLEQKGYRVTPVSNGQDALERCQEEVFDIVFLDESMPGLTGLETLSRLKQLRSQIPVVMITKNEEENLMEDAIGSQIADYLIKPVKPQQILLTLKKIIDNKRLVSEKTNSAYQQEFQRLFMSIQSVGNYKEWVEVFKQLTYWELELGKSDQRMKEVFDMQKSEANREFSKFFSKHYIHWMNHPNEEDTPVMSHNLMRKKAFSYITQDKPTVFLLIDNLRYDQWRVIQPMISEMFKQKEDDTFFSILPSATQYSRNAIFAGMTPLEIQQKFPQYWKYDDDEGGKNLFESELLQAQLKANFKDEIKSHYVKILNHESGLDLENNIHNYLHNRFIAIVYNFVDMLSHARTDMEVLKELASDESAFRSITMSWFEHSPLQNTLKKLAEKDINLIITTDHGTTRVNNPSKCQGDKSTSTNIRYKAGKNLQYEERDVFVIRKPEDAKLPQSNISTSYIFAKEDNYLIYQNNYNQFVNMYKNTFQHGGISLEEIIVPFAVFGKK